MVIHTIKEPEREKAAIISHVYFRRVSNLRTRPRRYYYRGHDTTEETCRTVVESSANSFRLRNGCNE